jgi:hypothetical protein
MKASRNKLPAKLNPQYYSQGQTETPPPIKRMSSVDSPDTLTSQIRLQLPEISMLSNHKPERYISQTPKHSSVMHTYSLPKKKVNSPGADDLSAPSKQSVKELLSDKLKTRKTDCLILPHKAFELQKKKIKLKLKRMGSTK